MTSKFEPTQNHLLAALPPEVQDRLFPHLELVQFPSRAVVSQSGEPIRHIYFPTDSIVSLHYLLTNGDSTGVSIVGNEGLVGIGLFLGGGCAICESVVQSAGFAYRLPRCRAMDEFNLHGKMCVLILRYGQALLTQISQTAVCNRHHVILQQLCRWLLISMDRVEGDSLTMTQDFISSMLGVRREGVTEAAVKLQRLGVITYARGKIRVLDRPKLETLCCECYGEVKRETDLLLDYLPQSRGITITDLPRPGGLNAVKRPKESVAQIRYLKRRSRPPLRPHG